MFHFNAFSNTICVLVILLILTITTPPPAIADSILSTSNNPCVSKTVCSECIQTDTCAWCLQPDFNKTRCFKPDGTSTCLEEYAWDPWNEQRTLIQRELSREQQNIVQISPQRIALKLRAHQAFNLNFKYAVAEDYPMDLYYLVDVSKSMADDIKQLSNLGISIVETLTNITSNFRLGFGTFVGKNFSAKKLDDSFDESQLGFINHMPLSTDANKFTDELQSKAAVRKSGAVTGNLESGLDAIMQAIVCREEIGWRKTAKRVLVFVTNSGFHFTEGEKSDDDVVTLNDGNCHMRNHSSFSQSTGYPDKTQILSKVRQNKINIIFAVPQPVMDVYDKLTNYIEGSSRATLSDDSSNVLELIKEEYGKISSSVEIKDTATSDITIKYHSTCNSSDISTATPTNKCNNLKIGDVVQFKAAIEVITCSKNPKDWTETFQIYPVGTDGRLTIDLQMICGCPCDQPDHPDYEMASTKCNGNGIYKCGICECDGTHFGRYCEVSTK